MTVAFRIDLMGTTLPAAAVPVSVNMPEPMTAPIPSAVRLHGPRLRRSFFSGSSEAAISASMLFVRKMLTAALGLRRLGLWGLTLTLALRLVTDLLLERTAGHAGGAFRLGRRFLAGRALDLLAFNLVGDGLRVHQFLFNPAYFSTSFFSPKRGKLTVILASSPSPSRRTTVPVPYLGCSTVMPVRAPRRTAGGAAGTGAAGSGGLPAGRGNCGGVRKSGFGGGACPGLNGISRSPKNC